MENSDKVISSSTTSNPSPSSKSDENDQNYPPSAANLNRRKIGETEMLVTKKVLSELNEAIDSKFTENSFSEIPNVDPKPSSCQGDSVFETTLPYDPLTNYLSPRPRFLRYKPSKRREIFLRTVGEDSLSVSHTSSSEEEETKMKEEEKEGLEVESEGKSNEIDDEGGGDKEEEIRGWTVKELLKFLLVVASLISSTLYITSMNTPSPSFEVSGAFNSGSFPTLNRTSEFESSPVVESIFANGSNSWDEEVTEAASFIEDLEKLKSELVELMHTDSESVLKAVLGLSVSSAMITCLVLSFQHKKKKDDSKVPAISVSIEPLLQDPVAKAEKVITRESPVIKATCDANGSNNKPIRNVDAFKTLLSSSHSKDKAEKMYHNEAPTVQFLGEFVVGEISNSLKNKSGMKNWTIEVEDSNFPGSVEEKPVSKNMNTGSEQVLSEFSATTSSPSYGSFTTKKKIVKKEVGGDGEVKSIQTPVRRSTRIRNRMVSP